MTTTCNACGMRIKDIKVHKCNPITLADKRIISVNDLEGGDIINRTIFFDDMVFIHLKNRNEVVWIPPGKYGLDGNYYERSLIISDYLRSEMITQAEYDSILEERDKEKEEEAELKERIMYERLKQKFENNKHLKGE